jgi:hypothetical protein
MADGEVTAAGFYFSNNIGSAMNDTGIRRATTSTMVFDTASTERMRIDSSGRVLIGQFASTGSTNADELVIGSGSGNQGITIFSGASNGSTIAFKDSGANEDGFVSYNHANQFMQFGTAETERMRLDAGGSLLIGETTPTDLHNTWNHIIIGDKGSIISQNGSGGIDGMTISSNAYIDADTGGYAYITTDEATKITQENGNITFNYAASGTAGNAISFSTSMKIDSSGHVGIGRTTPSHPLHIGDTSGNTTLELQRTNTNTSGSVGAISFTASDDHSVAAIHASGDGDNEGAHLIFRTTSAASENNYFNSTSERMRITSDGDLLVGVTSTNYLVADDGIQIRPHGFIRIGGDGTAARNIMSFVNDTGGTPAEVGAITTSGSSTVYATSSDHRLKENVVYDWDATTRLKQLKPARFNFIADADTTVDGFLAHEAQSVVPEAITGTHNQVDAEGNPVYQGIDQSKLVPLLVKTIQELEARITALEGA